MIHYFSLVQIPILHPPLSQNKYFQSYHLPLGVQEKPSAKSGVSVSSFFAYAFQSKISRNCGVEFENISYEEKGVIYSRIPTNK
jgi:hypothetical protein